MIPEENTGKLISGVDSETPHNHRMWVQASVKTRLPWLIHSGPINVKGGLFFFFFSSEAEDQ